MRDLLDDIDRWRTAGKRIALARVVDIQGSGPREAGAAMAVKTTGLISKTGSGKEISSCLCVTTASAATGRTTVLLSIDRPSLQGRVT